MERPHWRELVQGHRYAQELSRAVRLCPVQRELGHGLSELPVSQHAVHHAGGGHGPVLERAEQRQYRRDYRCVCEHRF